MRSARSKIEADLDKAIVQLWPGIRVEREVHIRFRGRNLYIDRLIPSLQLALEADGIQHEEFSSFFHKDADGYNDSLLRDKLKEAWLEENDYLLLRFSHKDVIDRQLLRDKYFIAMQEAYAEED